jgi:HEAT repeat protein
MMIVLALMGCDPAPEDIAKAIQSDNPVMREDGAKIAQNYDDDVVVAALVAVLKDPSEQVRLNAIESLAEIEATSSGDALVDVLRNDTSPKVRRAAADALGRLKIKAAIPDLITYVDGFSADDHEQLAGLWALGYIGSEGLEADAKKAALHTLVTKREGTTDTYVRYNASAALRTLK